MPVMQSLANIQPVLERRLELLDLGQILAEHLARLLPHVLLKGLDPSVFWRIGTLAIGVPLLIPLLFFPRRWFELQRQFAPNSRHTLQSVLTGVDFAVGVDDLFQTNIDIVFVRTDPLRWIFEAVSKSDSAKASPTTCLAPSARL